VRIIDFSPRVGGTTGGSVIQLSGWGFQPGADVLFGMSHSGAVSYASAATVQATLPAAPSGIQVPVKIVNPDGSQATASAQFQYSYETITFSPVYVPSTVAVTDFTVGGLGRPADGTLGIYYVDTGGQLGVLDLKTQSATPYNYGATNTLGNIAIADYNQDGALDAAVAMTSANQISIRLYDQNAGALSNADTRLGTDVAPAAIASVDLDGDSLPDLITANQNDINWLLNTKASPGTFQQVSQISPMFMAPPTSLAILDLNGDSRPDLYIANNKFNQGTFLFNQGSGGPLFSLAPGSGTFSQTVAGPITDLKTYDVDGDGHLDLCICQESAGIVSIIFQTSNVPMAPTNLTIAAPRKAAFADINNDGLADLLVMNASASKISIFLQQRRTLPTQPIFAPVPDVAIDLSQMVPAGTLVQIAAADFPPIDHKVDVIAAANLGTTSILLFLQNTSH
jgi:hypothetical protein